MKKAKLDEAEVIPRDYGSMTMLAGGVNLKTAEGDLRILEIAAGMSTSRHYHERSESIFHVMEGTLEMEVDGLVVPLEPGDTLVVEPHEVHVLKNIGRGLARVMEGMSPPFSAKDTFYVV
jgi:quercetin dioxygenase-like cupin family protein